MKAGGISGVHKYLQHHVDPLPTPLVSVSHNHVSTKSSPQVNQGNPGYIPGNTSRLGNDALMLVQRRGR